MKKRILVLMLLLMAATFAAEADPVDMRTVREVAVKFVNANAKTPLRSADDLQLVTTYSIDRGDAAFHIFNTSNGFVIVAADDCATPILGYSDEGQFELDNIPVQLVDYLDGFVEQIQYGIEHRLTADEAVANQWESVRTYGTLYGSRATTNAVEPLLTSTWGQECYYNNLCPHGGPCGHALTGCIPTAMGQIMRYWGYPTNGTGSVTYTPSGYPQQSVNFVEAVYDYDNMPDYLDSSSDSTQIDAVARLLWHCGVAVRAEYGSYMTTAYDFYVSRALKDYFLYSSDLYAQAKDDVDNDVWLAQVKACLDLSRPLYYSGGGGAMNEVGHAFVCDGYDSNDLLHFNWGWEGIDDGYYALNALNTTNYYLTSNQYAVFDIYPACNGETYQVSLLCSSSEGGMVTGAGMYECGSVCTITATANEGYRFYYWSQYDDDLVSIDETYSFAVSEDIELVANFGLPIEITATADPGEGGAVSGGGEYHYGHVCTLTAIPNEGYAFCNWTKDGEVVSCLSDYSFSVTGSVEYVANFQPIEGIAIGDAEKTSRYLPIYTYYSLSQQIYTAEEMGSAAREISCVSFFNANHESGARNISVYMVNTDKIYFESDTDWITVTEADQVFNGNVIFGDRCWSTIYFDTPFVYDGSSNVALIVDDNTSSLNITHCRTFTTNENQAIYIYGSSTNFDPSAPSSNTGSRLTEKNQVVFGHPSYGYTVTATADPVEGGTVSGGGSCYYGQPVTLTATPDEGYVFNYWTKDGQVASYFSNYTFPASENANYVANFQTVTNGIVVGDAPRASFSLPTTSSPYTLSQQIYTADEMNTEACEISSVSFFNAGKKKTRRLSIFLTHTDKAVFENGSDWVTLEEEDLFYSGYVVLNAGSWTTIRFNTPFSYDGTSNLVMTVNDITGSYCLDLLCRTFNTESKQAIYDDGFTSFDPYNLSNYSGSLPMEKNQVIFGMPSYDYEVTVNANPEGGGTVSGGGMYYYGQTTTLDAIPNDGYVFNNWTKNGSVVSYFSTYNITVNASDEYVANFQQMDGIIVGDAISTNSNLPTNANSYYSLTQQIYTVEELDSGTCEISSVSFFNTGTANTRDFTIYMVNTDKTSFDSINDWIAVTEADQVFCGSINMAGMNWTTICFNTPFAYDGSSNVALVVDDNSKSYSSSINCRTFSTNEIQAIRVSSSSTNLDPCNPSNYTGTFVSSKNQVVFGIPSYDYTVTVSANPEEGVVTGGGLCFYNQPITLTAAPNEGYVFNNWTKNGEVVSFLSVYNLSVTESAEYVANFQQIDGIIVGDAISTNSYLPTYAYSGYSMTQQIYTAEEMDCGACEISSISFFDINSAKTRKFTIYMVNTSKTSFDSNTDWLTVTESDQVFSGSVAVAARNWTTICFDTPFVYDGSSNIALVVDDNSNWVSSEMSCRTFATDENQAIRIRGSGTNYDPYNPSGYTGTLMSVKNQIILGITPLTEQTMTLTAGVNWVSFNVETNLDDLKTALLTDLPETTITIKGKSGSIKYIVRTHTWNGTLDWDMTQMYKIEVPSACEIVLVGAPINPAEHPITISPSTANWIGYPLAGSMTVAAAFADFGVVTGDVVKSKSGSTRYRNGSWRPNGLTTLEPGQGYIFNSAATGERTLVFPSGAK